MHILKIFGWCAVLLGLALASHGAEAKIKKVLPQFIDAEGRHMLSPSLYERDAYQARLRERPDLRAGQRFAILWKARHAPRLTMRLEMRGTRDNIPTTATIQAPVHPRRWLSRWSYLTLRGDNYEQFGELVAWRVTLWDGERQVAEHKSFLW